MDVYPINAREEDDNSPQPKSERQIRACGTSACYAPLPLSALTSPEACRSFRSGSVEENAVDCMACCARTANFGKVSLLTARGITTAALWNAMTVMTSACEI